MSLNNYTAGLYNEAQPFPHAVIDDFLDEKLLSQVVETFPTPDHDWFRFFNRYEFKFACNRVSNFPLPLFSVLTHLNSPKFLACLSAITGIPNLIADPQYIGGGVHLIQRGGHLGIHAEFNRHPSHSNWKRRLNLLLYLNQDWKEEYGGHLELWDKDMTHAVQRILPVFNRCVIFNTDETSYHGHPDPLTCPETMARKSIATYYYTLTEDQEPEHSTLFKDRPHDR